MDTPNTDEQLQALTDEFRRFAHILSHDMGAPLRHIREFHRLLIEDLGSHLTDQNREYVGFVDAAIERMQGLLDGLLEFSRLSQEPDVIDGLDLMAMAREHVEGAFAVRAQQIQIADGQSAIVSGDPRRLRKLLGYLIDNGLRYQADADTAQVKVAVEPSDADSGTVVVSIRDNGIGVEERSVERMFEMMQRLHAQAAYGGGRGMGLTLARKIARQHGGDVSVTSKPGEGSEFRIELPVRPAAS